MRPPPGACSAPAPVAYIFEGLPPAFGADMDAYLRHLVFERAQALHPSPVSEAGLDEARRRLAASDPNLRSVEGPPPPRR